MRLASAASPAIRPRASFWYRLPPAPGVRFASTLFGVPTIPLTTRSFGILLLALALSIPGCSFLGRYSDNQPSTTTDICRIFSERPHWYRAARASESRWGAPVSVQMAIIWRESAYRKDIRPPRKYLLGIVPWGRQSSSHGFTQAVDGTWDWYIESTGNRGADRDDFADSSDFVGWYVHRSYQSSGIPKSDAYRNYLAYHEGHAGYRQGRHRNKPDLLRAASEVEAMARRYDSQLRRCRSRLG